MKENGEGMSDQEPATLAEIEAALTGLSSADLLRLERFARWRMAGLGREWRGSGHEDLLAEALTATISGERKWNKRVEFVRHLLGTMRSISSHWGEKRGRGEEVSLPVAGEDDREELSGEGRLASHEPPPDMEAVARIQLKEIESLFSGDPEVLAVIEGLRAELAGPEIQELLEISETEYWTTIRRMRRTLERHALRGGIRV